LYHVTQAERRWALSVLAIALALVIVASKAQIAHIVSLVKLGAADLWPARNYDIEKPCPNDLFLRYKKLYAYDKTPLHAQVESVEERPGYRRERISFDAAYGKDRVIGDLYLPGNAKPPFQTVIHFPGSYAIDSRILDPQYEQYFNFLVESGRAVFFPRYKGSLERQDGLLSDYPDTTASYRDHVIDWAKDIGRSIDYLETRPEIDCSKLAYEGVSWGAAMGAIMTAVDDRFKVNALLLPGFYLQKTQPEVDQINFAPRVRIPTLMLNGRFDLNFSMKASQRPMFRLLGTPMENKRHVLYYTGHSLPRDKMVKETLDWFDRYLGPAR
jgi:eukaryotic-like serine/threonine-protein kinase